MTEPISSPRTAPTPMPPTVPVPRTRGTLLLALLAAAAATAALAVSLTLADRLESPAEKPATDALAADPEARLAALDERLDAVSDRLDSLHHNLDLVVREEIALSRGGASTGKGGRDGRKRKGADEPEREPAGPERKMGVIISKPSKTILKQIGQPAVRLVDVEDGGPAARAGLRKSDYILQVGDATLENPEAVGQVIADAPEGAALPLVIWRSGKVRRTAIRILSREELARIRAMIYPLRRLYNLEADDDMIAACEEAYWSMVQDHFLGDGRPKPPVDTRTRIEARAFDLALALAEAPKKSPLRKQLVDLATEVDSAFAAILGEKGADYRKQHSLLTPAGKPRR